MLRLANVSKPALVVAPNTGTPLAIMNDAQKDPEVARANAQIATARQMLDLYDKGAPDAQAKRGRAMSQYGIEALCFPAIGAMAIASHIAPVIGAIPAMSLIIVGPALGMLLVSHIGNQRAKDKQEGFKAGRKNLENQVTEGQRHRDQAMKAAAERLWHEAQAHQAAQMAELSRMAQPPKSGTLEQSQEAVTINGVRVERKSEG